MASSTLLKVACVQLNNGPDTEKNLRPAEAMIRQAASDGAQLVCTPEYSCLMREVGGDRLSFARPEAEHPVLLRYQALARELGVYLLLGSVSIKIAADRIHNRSFLIDPSGRIVARYNKIHLFDVDLPNGQSFRESRVVAAGTEAVVAETPWGGLGMMVCYDLRFPALARALAQAGACLLTAPSAFSLPTGQAHWELFLRSRAAETGCFVIAPAQCGHHEGTRRSFGHSMIVSPWGKVLACAEDEACVISATLDMHEVERYRLAIPALSQDRVFSVSRTEHSA